MLKPPTFVIQNRWTLEVDAAAQSLLGAAGHVARTLLRDPSALSRRWMKRSIEKKLKKT